MAKVLSLFDGMSCGMIAMQLAGVEVESYDAYEIDKYAIKTAQHNFPMIKEHGDVFEADFTQYEGVDFLIGGSPCTYWSIAQTKNRETVASGMGWELFSQYVRALHEAKPKYFIYENNKSMSKQIRASIDKAFGFEAVLINSALVSAQNRQRLYWVGKRNEDGTYSKVMVDQPEDRGIMLRDILETGIAWHEKSYCITATEYKGSNPQQTLTKHRRTMVAEPIEPRCVAQRGRYPENPKSRVAGLPTEQMYEAREDGKTNTLTTVQKDNMIAVPARVGDMPSSEVKICGSQSKRIYSIDWKAPSICATETGGNSDTSSPATRLYAVPITQTKDGKSFAITSNYVNMSEFPNDYSAHSTEKSVKPIVAVPYVGQVTGSKIYEVRNGLITIKGKQYPIKLADGYYIIRKLTVRECMRLQTVPEWYEFPVSDSQAYKMLGNGWTCEVIAHLIRSAIDA